MIIPYRMEVLDVKESAEENRELIRQNQEKLVGVSDAHHEGYVYFGTLELYGNDEDRYTLIHGNSFKKLNFNDLEGLMIFNPPRPNS
jgi:hypothetical protein